MTHLCVPPRRQYILFEFDTLSPHAIILRIRVQICQCSCRTVVRVLPAPEQILLSDFFPFGCFLHISEALLPGVCICQDGCLSVAGGRNGVH